MRGLGQNMSTGLGLPLALVGGASVKLALDFEKAMTLVSTQAGMAADDVEKLKQPVLDLSREVGLAPTDVADGLFRVASAGFEGAEAMRVLEQAAIGADVGQSNLEQTSAVLTAAMNSQLEGTEKARQTMAMFNATVGSGSMRMEDLVGAMSTGLLSRAATLGLNIQDVAAALATLTRAGVPAQAAATRLGMTFSLMAAVTSDQAKESLKDIGIEQTELFKTMTGPAGLAGAVELLRDRLKELPEAQRNIAISQIFGGGRTSGSIMTLLNNLKDMEGIYEGLGEKVKNFGETVREHNISPADQFDDAINDMRVSLTEFGEGLIPAVIPIVEFLGGALRGVADAFRALPQPVQTGILVFLGLLAIAGPVLMGIGGMTLGVYGLAAAFTWLAANPIVLIIGAIVALGIGLVIAYKKSETFRNIVDAVGGVLKTVATGAVRIAVGAFEWLKGAVEDLIGAWNKMKEVAGAVGGWFKGAFESVKGWIVDALNWLIDRINDAINAINSVMDDANVLAFAGVDAPNIGTVDRVGGGGGGDNKPGTVFGIRLPPELGGRGGRSPRVRTPRMAERPTGELPSTAKGASRGSTHISKVFLNGREIAEAVAEEAENRQARK